MNKNAIILFTKNPELGKVKTRLARTIGDDNALAVYKKLLIHTRTIVSPLKADKFVFYSNEITLDDDWSNDDFIKKVQSGDDLGERMSYAFQSVFKLGYQNICIIGSDCYELNTAIIDTAFEHLNKNDVVIGPTFDGGYYLLGMKTFYADFFENKVWSTETVYEDTISNFKSLNLSNAILTKLTDIDEEKDLPQHWK